MEKILEMKKVGLLYESKQGETEAIKDLNLTVQKGEFVAIVGPSGCGKTTLLSIISGILKPTSGEVLLNGKNASQADEYIGYMFQRDQLFEWRTILKNILIGLEIKGKISENQLNNAKNLAKKYGLFDFLDKKPRELSGGMRQRVALIRTLILNPNLLLLDEPFSALDFQTRLSVCDDVANIIKSEHKTAILVTHDISEAISMADRVVILTKRPATIKKIVEINIPGNTPFERRESPEFSHYFNEIWKELQYDEKT